MTGQSKRLPGSKRWPSSARWASWLEIDLGAVRHNTQALKELLGPTCSILAVVKADAYGHGALPVSRAALQAGASGLAVASLAEGVRLRRAGVKGPILLLGAGDTRSARRIPRLHLSQTLCSTEMAQALSRAAQQIGSPARVHVKIDTGMGRLGVRPGNGVEFTRFAASQPGLQLDGVFSHLACAEEPDEGYTRLQFGHFQHVLRGLAAAGISPGLRHLANSAAALRYPEMRLDGVRTGLLIYGLRPDAPDVAELDLRPALTWKTRVAFRQRLPAGSRVSYGGTYVTAKEQQIGVLPLGYADGYPRHASNRAHVLVRGKPCPVIGVVCMDHVMVDLGPAGEVQVGEEVVLIGTQGTGRVTANQLAQWAGTVVHAVPTVIGHRVARVYLDHGEPLEDDPDP
jgi:alanine racemase